MTKKEYLKWIDEEFTKIEKAIFGETTETKN